MKPWFLIAIFAFPSFAPAQYGLGRLPPVPLSTLPPDIPVLDPDPSFPLRVHLFTARWGGKGSSYHGYGNGNIVDANVTQGFDYAFECGLPFVANESPSENYQARWKHSPFQLEILTGQLGTDRAHTCNLSLALRARPFDSTNTVSAPRGVPSSLRAHWQPPDSAYEDPAPDYSVQFHVLTGFRSYDSTIDQGWGTANISDPAPQKVLEGADFHYDCPHGFFANSQLTDYFQGHWIKTDKKLEILLQRPGSDKIDRCTVEVALKPQPYPERHPLRQAFTPSAAPVFPSPPSTTP